MGIFGMFGKKAAERPRSTRELAVAYAAWLRRTHPETAPRVIESETDSSDGWLEIVGADGQALVVYVDTLLRSLDRDGGDLDERFAANHEAFASIRATASPTSTLLPLLKTRAWLDGASAARPDGKVVSVPAHRPLVGDLVLTYVADEGGAMRFLDDARIAVPARDLLLIADTADPHSLERQREIVTEVLASADYALTAQIFGLVGDELTLVDP